MSSSQKRYPAEFKRQMVELTLRYTDPPVWRRGLVSGEISLHGLHRIIQILMQWYDYHLPRTAAVYRGSRISSRPSPIPSTRSTSR